MATHPKDPSIGLIKPELAESMVKTTRELIPSELHSQVQRRGLQEVLESLIGEENRDQFDLTLFTQSLPAKLFPPELLERFLKSATERNDLEEAPPVLLLYQFLFPHFQLAQDYPNNNPPGIVATEYIQIPVALHDKQSKEISMVNFPRTSANELAYAISSWLDQCERNDQEIIFYRATDWTHAVSDLERCMYHISRIGHCLEFGQGTYFSDNLEYVLDWLKSFNPKDSAGKSISVFRVDKSILQKMRGEEVRDVDIWERIVSDALKWNRDPMAGFIYGYSCANTIKVAKCLEPKVKTLSDRQCGQLCISEAYNCSLFVRFAKITILNLFGG